jgi:recombination endonuclease VII
MPADEPETTAAVKACLACGETMSLKRWANGIIESWEQYRRRQNCSRVCASVSRSNRVKTRTEKRCPRCGELKPTESFRPHRIRPDGRHAYCRPCENAKEAEKRRTPKGRARRDRQHYRKKYGLTPEQVQAMFVAQGDRCAICGRLEALGVDHHHGTGEIRGLLCRGCNQGLGNFRENPDALRRAAAYLQ